MKYVVEYNAHGDPDQFEVEASSILDAIEKTMFRRMIVPVVIDGDKESSYRNEEGGQAWQRVTINVLPGGFIEDEDEKGDEDE